MEEDLVGGLPFIVFNPIIYDEIDKKLTLYRWRVFDTGDFVSWGTHFYPSKIRDRS